MSPIRLRSARSTDAAFLAATYGAEVESTVNSWELVAPDPAEMAARWRRIVDAGYPYWIAEADGEPLGYAHASAWRGRPGYRYTAETSVYVRRSARRRGVGRILVEGVIAACEARGLRQLIAVIGDRENTASIELHRACGFTPIAVFAGVGWKFDRWLDSLWLQRSLGPGSASPPAP
ncbi:MAG: N-acetyltransferase family protein [Nannocystaceae bacterium]